jgi:hypothetical protein
LREPQFKASLGKKVNEMPSQLIAHNLSSLIREAYNSRILVQASLDINKQPYPQITKAKRSGGVT